MVTMAVTFQSTKMWPLLPTCAQHRYLTRCLLQSVFICSVVEGRWKEGQSLSCHPLLPVKVL